MVSPDGIKYRKNSQLFLNKINVGRVTQQVPSKVLPVLKKTRRQFL